MASNFNQAVGPFRQTFQIAKEAITWFPGHMAKSFQLMQSKIKTVDCIFEVHDARIPFSGRNPNFVRKLVGPKPHILILNKRDLIPQESCKYIKSTITKNDNISNILFTDCKNHKCEGVKNIIPLAVQLISKSQRFNRSEEENLKIMVIGVPNVGKSSLINVLRNNNLHKRNANAVGAIAGITRAVQNEVKVYVEPPVYILDTPGILSPNVGNLETGMKLALCSCLNDDNVGIVNIADFLLYWLNKTSNFSYVDKLSLTAPSDDVLPVLVKIATENNKFIKVKNVKDNTYHMLPNLNFAAVKLVSYFRKGELGKFILDYESYLENESNE